MTNAVISVSNLRKTYPRPKAERSRRSNVFEAVKDVSFHVNEGEIFGILGPNGAGKTTTLEIIEGLKLQTSGTITVLDKDNLQHVEEIKKQIGVQLQSSDYVKDMSLSELLVLFGALYGVKSDPDELLMFVNLQDKKNSQVHELSGGQKQRFTLASALVNNPKILFLDEPTTGLDPRARRDVWELVRNINEKGMTIVLTTHYMEEAEFLCDRVAIMDKGKILTINDPQKLIDNISTNTQISFLIEKDLPQDFWADIVEVEKMYSNSPKVILEINSLDCISAVVAKLNRAKIRFSGFTVRTASLEDVYLDLTGRSFGEEVYE